MRSGGHHSSGAGYKSRVGEADLFARGVVPYGFPSRRRNGEYLLDHQVAQLSKRPSAYKSLPLNP